MIDLKKRKLRYKQKIEFAVEKIHDLPERLETSIEIDAALYRIQSSIDAIMDVISMLVKDKGRTVGDDYENIQIIRQLNIIDKNLAEKLTMLNGLRNAIVHKYNHFEENTVIENIQEIISTIDNSIERIEHEIKTIFT